MKSVTADWCGLVVVFHLDAAIEVLLVFGFNMSQ